MSCIKISISLIREYHYFQYSLDVHETVIEDLAETVVERLLLNVSNSFKRPANQAR